MVKGYKVLLVPEILVHVCGSRSGYGVTQGHPRSSHRHPSEHGTPVCSRCPLASPSGPDSLYPLSHTHNNHRQLANFQVNTSLQITFIISQLNVSNISQICCLNIYIVFIKHVFMTNI